MRPVHDGVENGYAELTRALLALWSAREGDGPTDRVGMGADEPASVAAHVALSTASGLLALQTLDSLSIFTGRQHEPYIVDSEPFDTSLAGAMLTVAAPLVNGLGSDALPVDAIRLVPHNLAPSATGFRLRADAAGRRGGTYCGTVTASRGHASENVTVWLVIP